MMPPSLTRSLLNLFGLRCALKSCPHFIRLDGKGYQCALCGRISKWKENQ